MPFPYPPAFLLVLLPFGLLSFPAGLALWSTATFAIYMGAARRAFPSARWLPAAFAPVFATAAIGQNGFVTAAIFFGGMVMLARRPFAAGLLLGCLAVKPQLGLLLPVALIAAGQWRAIAGAAIASVESSRSGSPCSASRRPKPGLRRCRCTARSPATAWSVGASSPASTPRSGIRACRKKSRMALHFTVAAAAALFVWRVWRSPADLLAKAAVLGAATMLISPYLFLYDGVILALPFLWLAQSGERPAILAPLALLPFVSVAQIGLAGSTPNLLPVVPLALTALLWMRFRKYRTAASSSRCRLN